MQALRAWIGLCIFFSCGLSDNWSAEPEVRFNLLTLPSSRQADLRLALPARLNYEHAPLRLCMAQLSERFQFSYWIDRRVDADKPVTIAIAQGTLRECITKLAQACDAEMGLVENVVTIARPDRLAAMQYAAVRLHNQLSLVQAGDSSLNNDKPTNNKKNAELRPLAWPQLTTPSELAELINSTWKLTLVPNLPHDLMNAGKLQPCTVSTQLTLLYGGFDQCSAGQRLGELKVLPIPKSGNWQATYAASLVSAEQVSIVKRDVADARLEKSGATWIISGPTSVHLTLLQPPHSTVAGSEQPGRTPRSTNSSSPTDPLSKQRFDISKQTDKPLGAILKNLGEQLGLTIEWDKSLPPTAEQTLVTIEANKSKLDDILAGLAIQARLSISREGTLIKIREQNAQR